MIFFFFLASCSDLYFSGNTSHKFYQSIKKNAWGKNKSCCGESYKMTLMQNPVSGTLFYLLWFCVVIFRGCKFETVR